MDKVLGQTLRRILKALMQQLYARGFAFGDFMELAKQTYVEVVEQELQKTENKATTSRISAVTGLTRKDVARLRKTQTLPNDVTQRYNRNLRVISAWSNEDEFLDADGQPAKLPLHGEQGSFERLVGLYSGDLTYRAMLDEMSRIKLVEVTDDVVALKDAAYIPFGDDAEKLAILGTDVSLLIGTINHNLTADDLAESRYQRKVSYDNLPRSVLPAFQVLVNEHAQKLLIFFNKWLAEHDRDRKPGEEDYERMRAGVGIYYFEEPVNEEDSGNK